jgi:2-polyprenyl-6-methoxyphenol hydroxylase-like FAD-dependent oxidoreductase
MALGNSTTNRFQGLSLALALHTHGLTCTIYELRESSFKEGGGLTLTPNALKILDLLGVYDFIRAEGYQFDKILIKTDTNVKVAEMLAGSQEVFGYDALRIHRQILLNALRKLVGDRGIEIRYGRKFSKVTAENGNGVTFEFEDGSTEAATLLIGADGIHSKVRQCIHPTIEPKYTGIMALISAVDRSALRFPSSEPADNYLPCFIAGKLGVFVILPQSPDGNTITAFSQIHHPETDKAGWYALRESPDKLATMHRQNKEDWPDLVQSALENILPNSTTFWPYSFLPHLDSWISPGNRVILLGDAAHAIQPVSGQGAAQAFEDAYSLALLLSKLGPQVSFDAALEWWQQYRMERTRTILELTKILNDKRLPREKQENPEEQWRGTGQEKLMGWLYMPEVKEKTLAWVEKQAGKQNL